MLVDAVVICKGSHSPGKPGKLLEFCKPGKLENSWNFMLDLEFLV